MRPFILALFVLLFAARLAAEDRPPLTIFAAASLGEGLRAALEDFPAPTRLSLGGSGAMARQVAQGAPADAVMLAHPQWMDWLESQDALIPGTRGTPIGNRLVLVGPPGAAPVAELTLDTVMARLGPAGRLAMGEHRSVPAGQYGHAVLARLGLWDALRPRLAEVENVRAALALVARGEVPLALVYASDLTAAPGAATLVWQIPDAQQPDIAYVLAATSERGRALVDHLTGPEALEAFAAFGFPARTAP